MKKNLKSLVRSIEPELRNYRRDFHTYAEPGWGEYRTASIIAQRLEELGYRIRIGREVIDEAARMGLPSETVMAQQFERAKSEGAIEEYADQMRGGFTGVVGELTNGDGPVLGFRFDIDAVEMEEKEQDGHLPFREGFASIHPEAMHSCGHDGHAAIGLGLAEVISRMKDELRGTVRLIFQPAEEGVRGAKAMVEAGVVDGLDYLLGMHIGAKAKKTGEFFCGTCGFLATSKFDAFFHGFSTHAGFDPQDGRNALLAAATAVLNLHAISRHGDGSTRINVGKMSAGSGRNVIPAEAHLVLETRGEDSKLNGYMKEYAERIIRHAAEMHGVEYSIVQMGEAASADSDAELMKRIHRTAEKKALFPALQDRKATLGGSEDFTHMMKRVSEGGGKATYCMLGSNLAGNHHTGRFDFDESILVKGVHFLFLVVLDILGKGAK